MSAEKFVHWKGYSLLPPVFFLKWTNIKVVEQSRHLSFVEFTESNIVCEQSKSLGIVFFSALTKIARKAGWALSSWARESS